MSAAGTAGDPVATPGTGTPAEPAAGLPNPGGDYGAASIKLLKGLEAVRKRPGMYIGNTDDITGLHHMVTELVDNAIDEAQAGYCDTISVVVHADDSVTVEDNGRGIPVGPHPVHNRETLEIILTDLHSGGKFDDNAYKVSGGLHGVGLSVVNALAGALLVEVKREGKVFQQHYAKGVPGRADPRGREDREDRHEDHVQGRPRDLLRHELQLRRAQPAPAGARVPEPRRHDRDPSTSAEPKGEKKHVFRYEGGIKSFVEHLNKNKAPLHDAVITFADVKNPTGDPRAGREAARAPRRRAPVERGLRGADVLLHEHDREQGRRDPPRGPQGGAHARDPALRRRCRASRRTSRTRRSPATTAARGSRRSSRSRSATRSSPRRRRRSSSRRKRRPGSRPSRTSGSRASSRRTRRSPAGSSRRSSTRRGRARRRARPASSSGGRARSTAPASPASSRTARKAIRRSRRSSSSRATRPAARPSRGATGARRRSSRSRARS